MKGAPTRRGLWLALLWLAFGLRVNHLDAFSLWMDEGLTPLRAGYTVPKILANEIDIQEAVTHDTHPPLYYLLIHYTSQGLGQSDFAYRYPSVLAGILLIPLLYQLGRRLFRPTVGALAASFGTINPLYIWYAQEARMYTLATLLIALMGYAVWRAWGATRARLWRWLALTLISGGLAVYTHYTAAFVCLGFGGLWLVILWRAGLRRWLVGLLVVAVIVAIPLIPYTLPRLLTGPEAAYGYVSPFVLLQDVVHGFGWGLTGDFTDPLVQALDVGLAGLLMLGLFASGMGGDRRAFLVVYGLAAVVGISLGSLLKPMYLGVRHIMVGSPAVILLLAQGCAGRPRRIALLKTVGISLVATTSLLSLQHLYADPQAAKDDFRALVHFIEQAAAPGDLVLYNNAILLPLHAHYQTRDDLSVTALPVYPHGAGPATLAQAATLAAQHARIWFVPDPPRDGRDAQGLVQGWLSENLRLIRQQSYHGSAAIVGVSAYSSAPLYVNVAPRDAQALIWQGSGLPELAGIRIAPEAAGATTVWLDLFWQRLTAPDDGIGLRLGWRGPDGALWHTAVQPLWLDARRAGWGGDGLVQSSAFLERPPALPPGRYAVVAQAWDEAEQVGVGEWQPLTMLELAAEKWSRAPTPTWSSVHFGDDLTLVDVAGIGRIRPGHPLPLTLYWHITETPPAIWSYEVEVSGPAGVLRTDRGAVGPAWYTPADFTPGLNLAQPIGIYFPPETPPGVYRLRWRVSLSGAPQAARPTWRPWQSQTARLGQIVVEDWPLITMLPAVDNLVENVDAQFGPAIRLAAYSLERPDAGHVRLTLYWQALTRPDGNYAVFVHLVDSAESPPIAQSDGIPVDWLRPTNGWRSAEILTDVRTLELPPDLPAGTYTFYIGFYDPASGARLPVTQADVPQPDGQLRLTPIQLDSGN